MSRCSDSSEKSIVWHVAMPIMLAPEDLRSPPALEGMNELTPVSTDMAGVGRPLDVVVVMPPAIVIVDATDGNGNMAG